MDMEDLVATGIIGLIKSVDSFDVNLNVKFSTYSSVCIQNEIKMQLRSVKKAKREISMQEVYQPKSINCNAFTLEDILQDTTESIEDLFIDNDCTLEVRKLINILSPIEKCIILLHFGFIHNRVFSQSEIGSLLNLSQSYVSRIINRVVKKLKTQISSAEKNGNRFYKDFYGETNFDFEKFIEKFIEEKKERGLPYTLQK